MAENIIKIAAEKVLLSAFRKRCLKNDKISHDIKTILLGSHKTYKYILVNALLAKATNAKVNPLALQAGAPINNPFDARSLCHNVLVPFERNFLENALGGSNEPFLNKPARFTHLNSDNAVRKGKDRDLLNLLISILESITTSVDASKYLACALEVLQEKAEENKKLHDSTIAYNPTLVEIYEFVFRFIEKSFEGESLAIVVGTLEKLYHSRMSKNYKVIVHKINQSGASSKEIGDIDVYSEDIFCYAIEVKDKNFSEYDLEHAFKKMQENGGVKGQFIFGPNANYDKKAIDAKVLNFEKNGFMVLLQDVYSYSRTMIFKIDIENKQEFVDSVMETAIEMNCKENTKRWIQTLLVELNWK